MDRQITCSISDLGHKLAVVHYVGMDVTSKLKFCNTLIYYIYYYFRYVVACV